LTLNRSSLQSQGSECLNYTHSHTAAVFPSYVIDSLWQPVQALILNRRSVLGFEPERSVTTSAAFRTLPFLLPSSFVGEAQAENQRSNL